MRILLADPRSEAFWALRAACQEEPELDVLGRAETAEDLLALVDRTAPDLVLLARTLPGLSIQECMARLRAREPKPVLVVMSNNIEDGAWAIRAGADAFISRLNNPDLLLAALREYARRLAERREWDAGPKPLDAAEVSVAGDEENS